MQKALDITSLKAALAAKGWDQKQLAEALGVSAQAVTNWMKGVDFPRPPTLLKLSTLLSLRFEKLVQQDMDQPVVAFRKKGATKTTEAHLVRARAMGAMLRPLAGYLPVRNALRTQISDTSLEYARLQDTAAAVRSKLGIGHEAVLAYEHLVAEFCANDAVIIPVMWGLKKVHENALHIHLPAEKVTFIYLNLDTHLEDFKFWTAHELAHVYTPELAGTDEGEDFADAFAGALLFPRELAHRAYAQASRKQKPGAMIDVLHQFASEHSISLFSVFNEVSKYSTASGLQPLKLEPGAVHAARNSDGIKGDLVSETLFKPLPPDALTYIGAATSLFKSSFFPALQALLRDRSTGAGYVQEVLGIAIADAQSIHGELVR